MPVKHLLIFLGVKRDDGHSDAWIHAPKKADERSPV